MGLYIFISKKNDPYTIDLSTLMAHWGAIIPCLITCMILDSIHNKNDCIHVKHRMLSLSLFSPLVIGAIYETNSIAKSTYDRLLFLNKGRQEPVPFAQSLYQQLKQDGRMQQFSRYDVYIPKRKKKIKKALLFFPGFLINHESYVEVAKLLSDNGILVIVLSMEPLRISTPLLGASVNTVKYIMNDVCTNFEDIFCDETIGDIEWNICGHSLGGYAASSLYSIMPRTFSKLVLWGCGSFPNFLIDLNQMPDKNKKMLIVLATNDRVCNFDREGSFQYLLSMCPATAKVEFCYGGNHCGFASYEDRVFDGIASISRKNQHKFICSVTSKFLFS